MQTTKISATFAIVLLAISLASAHEDTKGNADAGTLPGSLFFGLDIFAEKLKILFTFGDEKKIEIMFESADERLAEVRESIATGSRWKNSKAISEHKEVFLRLTRFLEREKSDRDYDMLQTNALMQERLEDHALLLEDLEEYLLGDNPKDRLANELLLEQLQSNAVALNLALQASRNKIRSSLGDAEFERQFGALRIRHGIEGSIDLGAQKSISGTLRLLELSNTSNDITKDHYMQMEQDFLRAQAAYAKGSVLAARKIADELSLHIRTEMGITTSHSPPKEFMVADGDIYQLEAAPTDIDFEGRKISMLAYNGQIPGPMLKVKQNTTLYVNFTNRLDMPTTVHWHGIRVENRFDGTPSVTQEPVMPNESFLYKLDFPDAGIFWYHPHIREDMQQELGLYGNIYVEPLDKSYYNHADREEYIFLDDIKTTKIGLDAFGRDFARFALMGRFGNKMFVNGQASYEANFAKGETVRLFLTNSANTRVFNFSIAGHKLRIVGSDLGKMQYEEMADSVIISPAERYIVEVIFDREGTYSMLSKSPNAVHVLGRINVMSKDILKLESSPREIKSNPRADPELESLNTFFNKSPDFVFDLTVDMTQVHGMDHGTMDMQAHDGIEWEDEMPAMNAMMTSKNLRWIIKDRSTGKENMDIEYHVRTGDIKKIRIFNDPKSMHPMQHSMHLHGQRFVVLSVDGKKNDNLVWKDTVLVPSGKTVDILVEFSNPGEWMFHCHIAEHLEAGMMSMFMVE